MRVVASPVHRHDVRHACLPCGPRAVHRHRELVTVSERDPIPTEHAGEPTGALERNRTIEPEVLDRDPTAGELLREPALTVGREYDEVVSARFLQLAGQVGDHALRAARTVALDQMCDPETTQAVASHVSGCWRGQCRVAPHRSLTPAT